MAYIGYSMSVNAANAYECGERPVSKWSKRDILALCGEKKKMLSKLNVNELKSELLYNSSWHHTSGYFNRTDFYCFNEDALEEITDERVEQIIASRMPKETKPSVKSITAEVEYTIWVGNYRNYKRPKQIVETVNYLSTDKMVKTSDGNKRLSSVTVKQIISEVDL